MLTRCLDIPYVAVPMVDTIKRIGKFFQEYLKHLTFNWNHKSNTIKIEPNNFNRKCRVALEMQFHKCTPSDGGLNLDDGQYVTTKFWKPLFQYMRNKKT